MTRNEFFEALIKHIAAQGGESKLPVAKLRPEDIIRVRTYDSDYETLTGEAEVLLRKAHVLNARQDAMRAELWQHLKTAYNLPHDGEYSLAKDQILKHVKKLDDTTTENEKGRL